MFPTMYLLKQVGPGEDPIEIMEDYPKNSLVQVNATGAAFLLMHREALTTIGDKFGMPYPWFAEGTVAKGGTSFGEDWAFCIRAQDCEFPIYVHTGAKIGHVKQHILNEQAFDAHRALVAEIGQDGVEQRLRDNFTDSTAAAPKDIRTYAVIPQKGNTHLTSAVCKQLALEKVPTLVIDNGSDPIELESMDLHGAELLHAPDAGIYEMWNSGVNYFAKEANGPFNIAIFNNDIRIGPHTMKRLATALRADDGLLAVCPNYDKRPGTGIEKKPGSYGNGGLAGFCFMVKGEAFGNVIPYFDENYLWWYGDDDFITSVWASGHQCGIVLGCTVEHLGGGGQTLGDVLRPDHPLQDDVLQDRERFLGKWQSRA
jgi:hypothetical protein